MYYSQIATNWTGFTNQIFSLIGSIIDAYKTGKKVVVVDNFLNDITKTTYTPISEIFNISKINIFLKENYDIIIVDKNDIKLEIISAKYGTNDTNFIDLTDCIKSRYFSNHKLFVSKECSFNDMKGDPCPGIVKHFVLNYRINEYYIEEIYDENLTDNIDFNFNGPYIFTLGWIDSFNDNMFDKILTNIKYNDDFELKTELMLKKVDTTNKINIIHLRLETDGIKHWSKQNKMKLGAFKKYVEEKYINLIKKYVSKTDENIILSSSSSNGVIDFLNKNNYNFRLTDKYFNEREKNAIIDLLVSKYCNNIFIGNFNIKNKNGSTFSYYIGKCMNNNVNKIYIDLDKIRDKEVVCYSSS